MKSAVHVPAGRAQVSYEAQIDRQQHVAVNRAAAIFECTQSIKALNGARATASLCAAASLRRILRWPTPHDFRPAAEVQMPE